MGPDSFRQRRWIDGLVVVALLGALAWVFQEQVVRPAARFELTSSDLYAYFWSAYAYEARRLHQWQLPLWNPHQGGGVPFLATLQPGALYPARLLLLWLGAPLAMYWSTLGHVGMTVAGTYVLCRTLETSRGGAIAAAIVTGMTVALPWIYWPSYLEAAAWMPIASIGLIRLARDGRLRWMLLTGLAAAMPALAGGYQVTLYAGYGLVLLALGLMVSGDGPAIGRFRFFRLAVGAGAVAAGTAAPQLLPTLAWTSETLRQTTPLTDKQIQPWGMMNWQFFRHTLFVRDVPMQMFHISIPVAVLAGVGFVTRGRLGLVLGLGAVVALLLACGPSTPVFVLYHWLPGLGMFRLPERLFILCFFLTAIGAAFGISWLADRARWMSAWLSIAVEIACVAGVAWVLVVPYENRSALPWVNPPVLEIPTHTIVAKAKRVVPGQRLYIPPGGASQMLGVRIGMIDDALVLQDYEPLSSRRLSEFAHAVAGRTPNPIEQDRQAFNGSIPLPAAIARPVLLDLLSVGGVVTAAMEPPPQRTPPFVRDSSAGYLALVRNPSALPRAYVVGSARFVADDAAALAAITNPAFTGRDEAVVVGKPDGADDATVSTAARTPFVPARIDGDDAERVTIAVAPEQPGLLVLTDALAPGWQVAVDGVPRRLLRTNYLVRGVVVRPGDHTVVFTYAAPGFRTGVTLAAVVWAIALAAALAGRWRRAGQPVAAAT